MSIKLQIATRSSIPLKSWSPDLVLILLLACGPTAWAAAPVQLTFSNTVNALPAKSSPNISAIVHGWTSNPTIWANGFSTALGTQVTNLGMGGDWDTFALDWRQDAAKESFFDAAPAEVDEIQAQMQGQYLAHHIASQTAGGAYETVHLFGHSLGGRVVQTAATALSQILNGPIIHTSFLDAYTPYEWDAAYGEDSDYADHYINSTDAVYVGTQDWFPHAFNVDVTALGGNLTGSAGHGYPHVFYEKTITDYNPDVPSEVFHGSGFPNSFEAGATPLSPGQNGRLLTLTESAATLTRRANVSEDHAFSVNPNGETILKEKSGDNSSVVDNLVSLAVSALNAPSWVNLGQSIGADATGGYLNYIEFDFDFTSADKDGMLAAYWNNKLIWAHKEAYELDATENGTWQRTGKIFYPRELDVFGGDQTFSFRLDSAAGMSNAQIRNLHGGQVSLTYLKVPEPASLLLTALALAGLLKFRRCMGR